jgi:predicted AlkP superfamily phosphohydrolase/phosphomutase
VGKRQPVVAIGIDAAEGTLVKRLAADGSLPTLRALGAEGAWLDVRAPAALGSPAVWPTFVTATGPEVHGLYCDWLWDPERMELRLWQPCEPFWARLGSELRVGALDVPMAAPTGAASAFEVCGWGPRARVDSCQAISPESAAAIVDAHDAHPFASRRGLFPGPQNAAAAARLGRACLAGIRRRGELARSLIASRRPDLALIVFPEVHEAGHMLWHTAEPSSALYRDLGSSGAPSVGGIDALLREVDVEIGRLIETAGYDAAVVVFAFDGMGPARGQPTFLGPVLRERRWTVVPTPRPGNASELARGALAWTKRRAPVPLRRAYHALVPQSVVWRVAMRTMLVPHDWTRTRAFALPTNQHGWIRINLCGRERDGIVAARDYEHVRDELAAELAELKTDDGRPLVSRVVSGGTGDVPPPLLPDLVLHWTEAAYDRPVSVADTSVEMMPAALEVTGTHRLEGFCVTRGLPVDQGPVTAERLPHLLISAADDALQGAAPRGRAFRVARG